MKKITFKEKFQYRFDNLMSKGAIALVGMLFLVTAIVVIVISALMIIVNHGDTSFGENIWIGVMHIIDAGTITAADTSQTGFIILMSIVTLCGLFVTSILIGIITTGFEEKLNDLKKGNSHVIEKDHTVILGFDNNVFTLISELITANESRKDACIVILCEQDKESIESAISEQFPDTKTTRIVCRTGNITDITMLKKCAIENARSIIINEEEDFLTVKSILAINNYFNTLGIKNPPHIVTTVNEEANYEASKLISEGNAEVILVQDSISRIIAQTCRQPGLSNVLIELFDYDGDELYFETCPELDGKTFGEVLNYFEKAVLFGYKRDGEMYLNPDKDIILKADDALLLLVEDDGMAKPTSYAGQDVTNLINIQDVPDLVENVLIIGTNKLVRRTMLELDSFFAKGSTITVANNEIPEEYEQLATEMNNINLVLETCDTDNRKNLEMLMNRDIAHVLLVSNDEDDSETADAHTLLKLIHLRDIAQKENKIFSITSEMQDVSNQKLAQITKVNDLVVGSNIINLILTQISENRDLANVFRELLQADGSEIYMRKASAYLKLDTPMDFYAVTEILKQRNEIAIGYKKQNGTDFDIITNPKKSDMITFTSEDYIISISKD